MFDPEIAYQALTARDSRFDGVFCRRDLHRYLLPSDLSGESADAEELPVFHQCRSG